MPRFHNYQLEAVKEILDKKRVILADDMGLGKTAEIIAAKTAIERLGGYDARALIGCPATVIPHWQKEVRKWYHKGDDTRVAVIRPGTFEEDLRAARDTDFTLISYHALSEIGKSPRMVAALKRADFPFKALDEAQNAKNPLSIRSAAVRDIYSSGEYLVVATGSPMPNSIVDLYTLLNLMQLKDEKGDTRFPLHSANAGVVLSQFYQLFRQDPEFVKKILHDEPERRMIRRTIESLELKAKFPKLNQTLREVQLDGEHREAYVALYENETIKPTHKLDQLNRAAIDPNLINPRFLSPELARHIGRMRSSVFESLDQLVGEVADSGGKVLIFSEITNGPTGKLTERLSDRYSKYGALVVDGEDKKRNVEGYDERQEANKREFIRKKFQQDPDTKVLIATSIMNEGVDLTAATDVVDLTIPYTPAAMDQRIRRSQRANAEVEKDNVNRHIIFPVIDEFTPCIVEGKWNMVSDKRKVIGYVMEGRKDVTKEQLREIANGTGNSHLVKSPNLAGLVRSPVQNILRHFGSLRGQGHKTLLKRWEQHPKEAEWLAKQYASHWEGYMGGNTANLYAQVIHVLEESGELERKLDIASGPFSLSRKLGEPVTNIDLNEYMLKAGRVLEEKGVIVPGNVAVQGSFHELPFDAGSFDLANLALALHYSKLNRIQGDKPSERELALREMNRVLRKGGYGLITLPASPRIIQRSDASNFEEGLGQLGFDVLPFSGFYTSPDDPKFRLYVAGVRKVGKPSESVVDNENLALRMEMKKVNKKPGAESKGKHLSGEIPLPPTPKVAEKFFNTKTKQSIDEVVREAL